MAGDPQHTREADSATGRYSEASSVFVGNFGDGIGNGRSTLEPRQPEMPQRGYAGLQYGQQQQRVEQQNQWYDLQQNLQMPNKQQLLQQHGLQPQTHANYQSPIGLNTVASNTPTPSHLGGLLDFPFLRHNLFEEMSQRPMLPFNVLGDSSNGSSEKGHYHLAPIGSERKATGRPTPFQSDKDKALKMFSQYVHRSYAVLNYPCRVCWTTLSNVACPEPPWQFVRCGHAVHKDCFEKLMKRTAVAGASSVWYYMECPTCYAIYGKKLGNQPEGTMKCELAKFPLPGYEDSNTLEIYYDFKSSVQGPKHPRPGCQYFAYGFPRLCLLPDTSKGRLVLHYLQIAFQRCLLFTICRSETTGIEDVVQTCVEQKTRVDQYPDVMFLDRCLAQLTYLGVAD